MSLALICDTCEAYDYECGTCLCKTCAHRNEGCRGDGTTETTTFDHCPEPTSQ